MNFAIWRALAGVPTGAICCQRARKKFEAGNAFVSVDGRSFRWSTVETSSQRLWRKSVMSVQEKCDEKVGKAQVSVQRTDANLGHQAHPLVLVHEVPLNYWAPLPRWPQFETALHRELQISNPPIACSYLQPMPVCEFALCKKEIHWNGDS